MNRWRHRAANLAGETIETALLAFLLASVLAGSVGVLALLPALQFGPPVGEILTFGPYDQPAPIWHVDAVQSSTNRGCVLKPAVMAMTPGSLVVEQRLGDGRRFVVHWAGGPTSDGGGDCGNGVDLTIGLSGMQTLVNADTAAVHWHFMGS